jgi:2-polyprenyl-3-methyl-5-hydroxy-6-metoxy-1,4-benzoquinol methylase
VPRVTLNRVAGYRRSTQVTQEDNDSPIIRSITHAPDQTGRRPQLVHCDSDLAAPDCCDCTSNCCIRGICCLHVQGQNSWLTSDEQDRFLEWLELSPGTLLDVACGAGGPALRIAATTGCSVAGIDVHEQAVTTARALTAQRGLAERAEFRSTDATGPLSFSDASFDAITCIDAINHFSDRPRVIAEWARLLSPAGDCCSPTPSP